MAAYTTVNRYASPVTFTIPAGTNLVGYKWNPTTNVLSGTKSNKWLAASNAHATAEYNLRMTTTVPPGIYLLVSDGFYAGYIILKSLVKVLTTTTPAPTVTKSVDPLFYPARFQFGQSGPCGGQTCCTDTCIQMIIEYWTERKVSLWDIRKASGESSACSAGGLNPQQTLNALRAYGITWYQAGLNVTADFVAGKINNFGAPVLVCVGYGKYPKAANGRCGSLNKAEIAGGTDCTFRGAHAVLALKNIYHSTHWDIIMRDPDHGSPARPEKPAYDRIHRTQLQAAMKALVTDTPWNVTYCLYPTKKKTL